MKTIMVNKRIFSTVDVSALPFRDFIKVLERQSKKALHIGDSCNGPVPNSIQKKCLPTDLAVCYLKEV